MSNVDEKLNQAVMKCRIARCGRRVWKVDDDDNSVQITLICSIKVR
jgi:hypothetical protein